VLIAVVLGLVAYALNSDCHVNGWSIVLSVALAILYRVYVLWVERNTNLAKQTAITTGSQTFDLSSLFSLDSLERKQEREERDGGVGLGIEDKEGASVGVEHADSMMDVINAIRSERDGQDHSRPSVEVNPGVRSRRDIWKKWAAVGITVTILFLSMYSICDFDTPVSGDATALTGVSKCVVLFSVTRN
jgi:hypothetical protein